jgi:hypothetical protein
MRSALISICVAIEPLCIEARARPAHSCCRSIEPEREGTMKEQVAFTDVEANGQVQMFKDGSRRVWFVAVKWGL